MTDIKNTIDAVLKEFEVENLMNNYDGKYVDTHKLLSIAVPATTKDRFDELQEKTGKNFGKALQKINKAIIDKIYDKK
jgi:vacuolar-type H+-ATPase subunit C/Vma6